MRISVLLFTLFLSLLCTAALAERPFSAGAKPGKLSPLPNRIVIDGKARQVAAGAQIRNQQNKIVQPQSLRSGSDVPVLYKENNQQQITRIWMLTNEEAQQIPDRNPAK